MSNDPRVALRVTAEAVAAGEPRSVRRAFNRYEWDRAGRCERPIFRTIKGRDFRDHPVGLPTVSTDLWLRCRRCPACLNMRRREWAKRASYEIMRAQRTWFCTFTLRPAEQYKALCEAGKRIPGLVHMDPEIQNIERNRVLSKEFTRYFKRVRKSSQARLRYCLVSEVDQSGLLHWHALVHEVPGSVPVLYDHLASEWTLGFTGFKLVKDDDPVSKVAHYVAKYLAKSALARVRASQRYGDPIELTGWNNRSISIERENERETRPLKSTNESECRLSSQTNGESDEEFSGNVSTGLNGVYGG